MNETMRQEIDSQPEVVNRAIPILRQQIAGLGLKASKGVIASGCGDSFFASQVAAEFFSPGPVEYSAATALHVSSYGGVRKQDLCILISISGNTRQTANAAVTAKRAGARTLAITCAAQSALAQQCDDTVLLPFTPLSRRTPHTLDYTMTVIALAIIAEVLVGKEFRWIGELASEIEAAIDRAQSDCRVVISDATERTRWFFLAGGPGVGVASYGAAKFHEAGGLPAWAAEPENFMHGMNFVIEPGDRVCLIAHDAASWQLSRRVSESLDWIGVQPWFLLPDGGIRDHPELGVATGAAALVTCAIPLQVLCLEHASRLGLNLEAPRAGRRSGEIYLDAQKMFFAAGEDPRRLQERHQQ